MRSILKSIFAADTSTEECENFMKAPENISQVAMSLDTSQANAKSIMAFLYINHEKAAILDSSALDTMLARLVASFYHRICDNTQTNVDILQAAERLNKVFEAWKKRDVNMVLQFLSSESVAAAVRNEEPDPDYLQELRAIGGEEAYQDTMQRIQRQQERFVRVSPHNLESHIRDTAERAYWDVLHESVASRGAEALFPLLHDLKLYMMALLSSPYAEKTEQFSEKFDLDFLYQQHAAQTLSRADVGRLAAFVAETMVRMQAPVDLEEAQAWLAKVVHDAEEETPIDAYLPNLVYFVRECKGFCKRVQDRLEAYSKK